MTSSISARQHGTYEELEEPTTEVSSHARLAIRRPGDSTRRYSAEAIRLHLLLSAASDDPVETLREGEPREPMSTIPDLEETVDTDPTFEFPFQASPEVVPASPPTFEKRSCTLVAANDIGLPAPPAPPCGRRRQPAPDRYKMFVAIPPIRRKPLTISADTPSPARPPAGRGARAFLAVWLVATIGAAAFAATNVSPAESSDAVRRSVAALFP